MRIKKGDIVKIMKGKDVGKQGKVLRIMPALGKVVVEGTNVYKRHVKGDGKKKESAIVDVVKPMSVANVRLICSLCGKVTKVGWKIEGGKRIRICKKCKKPLETIEGKKSAKNRSFSDKNKKDSNRKKKKE